MNDAEWMGRALQLARTALGSTAPNPAVGAVLVRDNCCLGEGYTEPVGGAHAEVVALDQCRKNGHDPSGATMYVTLEPCCHHGRTSPCTDAIIQSGVGRVVAGVMDPFPAMQGKGLGILKAAGISVELGVREAACAEQVLGFGRALIHHLPMVCCKAAMSVDGHIATENGESQWITGEAARADVHQMRKAHDAILVGISTVLKDDPQLNCRLADGADGALKSVVQPIPVILDSQLRIPDSAKLFKTHSRVIVCCAEGAPERELAAEVVRIPVHEGDEGLNVETVLKELASRGIHRVLVEGGAEIHRSFLDSGLVDRLELYVGGVVVAGGMPWVGGPPIQGLEHGLRLQLEGVEQYENDVRLSYRLDHRISNSLLEIYPSEDWICSPGS